MIDKINKGINTIHKKELESMKQNQKERPEQMYIKNTTKILGIENILIEKEKLKYT